LPRMVRHRRESRQDAAPTVRRACHQVLKFMGYRGIQGFFVTGTDTCVGKTLVAAGLLVAASARGMRSLGLKPVAAGCTSATTASGSMLVNDDALALQQAASLNLDYASVNPVALEQAIAPHIAAADSGVQLHADELVRHCRRVCANFPAQFVVVEGAGGWLVPLNETETMADFCVELGFPVIMVVGMKLGCLNHALLTARAVRAAGLPIAGWVANCMTEQMPAFEANLRSLQALLSAPLLGEIPHLGSTPKPSRAAEYLQLDRLVKAEHD